MKAAILFDLGRGGAWTVYLDGGRAAVAAAPPAEPDLVVRTSAQALSDMVNAKRPGYEIFLDGELEVRGNLALALELESLFEPEDEPTPGWPRTYHPKVGKLRWSVLEAGPPDGQPMVLLHGLGATKATFLPTLAAFAADHRVIAVDLPGFGDSSKPVASYDATWFAARVIELLDELEVKEAVLVGNSMGGRIAVEVGLRHPSRVRALVLLAPALAYMRWRQFTPLARLFRPAFGLLPFRPTRPMVLRAIRGIFAKPDRVPAEWFEAATDEFFRVWGKARGRRAFVAAGRAIYLDEPAGQEGFWARLADLEPPSLFVFGRQDPLIPLSFARHVADALPDARIAILDDCGHVPQFEASQTVHRLARGLLSDA